MALRSKKETAVFDTASHQLARKDHLSMHGKKSRSLHGGEIQVDLVSVL